MVREVSGHYDRTLACLLGGNRWSGGSRKDGYIINGGKYIHGGSKPRLRFTWWEWLWWFRVEKSK